MDIDLSALRLVERDREIPFNELVEIIEAAVEAAYHKNAGTSDPARAVLDQKTGKVIIFVPDTEERDEAGKLILELPDGSKVPEVDKTPENFGRIAAAAAKQVIAQRIRGLSDEGLYGEFKAKVEDIVAGEIQQGPRAYMVYVKIGEVEAILPPEEQVPGEDYSHGKRMRFYITKVDKNVRGQVQINVSRTHPALLEGFLLLKFPRLPADRLKLFR